MLSKDEVMVLFEMVLPLIPRTLRQFRTISSLGFTCRLLQENTITIKPRSLFRKKPKPRRLKRNQNIFNMDEIVEFRLSINESTSVKEEEENPEVRNKSKN